MEQKLFYRYLAPDGGPADTPEKLALWALGLLVLQGAIYAHRRDVAALQATMLGERVGVLPFGGPQPGTVFVEVAL